MIKNCAKKMYKQFFIDKNLIILKKKKKKDLKQWVRQPLILRVFH